MKAVFRDSVTHSFIPLLRLLIPQKGSINYLLISSTILILRKSAHHSPPCPSITQNKEVFICSSIPIS